MSAIDQIKAVCRTLEGGEMAGFLEEQRGKYQGTSPLVALPANTQEVSQVLQICHATGTAIVPQGGNTGLVGGAVANGAIVVSTKGLNTVRACDPVNRTITVESGCVLKDVQDAAEKENLLFPLSLAAEGSCTIGGNLATNAGGVQVLRYGNARELCLGIEAVLPDGRVWDGLYGLRKNNTGYDLKDLFIGAEGTLGIITAAVMKLFPRPKSSVTALVACPSIDAVQALFARVQDELGEALTAFEMMPEFALGLVVGHVGLADPFAERHPYYALIEASSSRAGDPLDQALESVLGHAFEADEAHDGVIAQNLSQAESLWMIRESIPEAQKHAGGSIKHDIAVPVSQVAAFFKRATPAVEALIPGVRVCAFGHMGDGNLHFNLTQPEGADKGEFLGRWDEANRVVHDIVDDMGGTFSAEHGIGQLKVAEMARYKADVELDLMRSVKTALDPRNIMNPGRVLP